ncbi:MAG: hypothetical protein WBQ73_03345 [Candidatus Babeliales bacterium]
MKITSKALLSGLLLTSLCILLPGCGWCCKKGCKTKTEKTKKSCFNRCKTSCSKEKKKDSDYHKKPPMKKDTMQSSGMNNM